MVRALGLAAALAAACLPLGAPSLPLGAPFASSSAAAVATVARGARYGCEDLGGAGSLDGVCSLSANATVAAGALLAGNGTLAVAEGASLACEGAGCELTIELGGNLTVAEGAAVRAGVLSVAAGGEVVVRRGGALTARGAGAAAGAAAHGRPAAGTGGGGGHGGLGHACGQPLAGLGGRSYGWSALQRPADAGAAGAAMVGGGAGGGGGGVVNISCAALRVEGSIDADGEDGMPRDVHADPPPVGGGGAGGSVHVSARTLGGTGEVSADGGGGHGGGGGGRIALVYVDGVGSASLSAHAFGGQSLGCADGTGGPGTVFLSSGRSLGVDNGGSTPAADTPLGFFEPVGAEGAWENLVVQGGARARATSPVLLGNQLGVYSSSTLEFEAEGSNSRDFVVRARQIDLADGGALRAYDASVSVETESLSIENGVLSVRFDPERAARDEGRSLAGAPARRGALSRSPPRASTSALPLSLIKADRVSVSSDSDAVSVDGALRFEGRGTFGWTAAAGAVSADVLVVQLYDRLVVEDKATVQAPRAGAASRQAQLNCSSTARCPAVPFDEVCRAYSKGAAASRTAASAGASAASADALPTFYTLLMCDVGEVEVEGEVDAIAMLFHLQEKARLDVKKGGVLSAAARGCLASQGAGAGTSAGSLATDDAAGGGAGFGGAGGAGHYNGSDVAGGAAYGLEHKPCNLGSGGGSASTQVPAGRGGGVIIVGSDDHLVSLGVEGVITAAGGDGGDALPNGGGDPAAGAGEPGGGGGSGGTILLHLSEASAGGGGHAPLISVAGGRGGADGGGGGGGGRLVVSWKNDTAQRTGGIAASPHLAPPTSRRDELMAAFDSSGGNGSEAGADGAPGTMEAATCPPGHAGLLCDRCALGRYKVDWGADASLCLPCDTDSSTGRSLPARGRWARTNGTSCAYECVSAHARLPTCDTPFEALVSRLGGPLGAGLTLGAVLAVMTGAIAARTALVRGAGDVTGGRKHGGRWLGLALSPRGAVDGVGASTARLEATPPRGDARRPLLESLVEVMESSGREDHVRGWQARLHLAGENRPASPWRLPHVPPPEVAHYVLDLQWMDLAVRVNALLAWQWWEAALAGATAAMGPAVGGAWIAYRRERHLARLTAFFDEYDFQCMRSVRARSLLEGMRLGGDAAGTVAWLDFFSCDGDGALGRLACGPPAFASTRKIGSGAQSDGVVIGLGRAWTSRATNAAVAFSPGQGGVSGGSATAAPGVPTRSPQPLGGGASDAETSAVDSCAPVLLLALSGDGTLRSPLRLSLDPLAQAFAEGVMAGRSRGAGGGSVLGLGAWGAALEGLNARLRGVRACDMAGAPMAALVVFVNSELGAVLAPCGMGAVLACRPGSAGGGPAVSGAFASRALSAMVSPPSASSSSEDLGDLRTPVLEGGAKHTGSPTLERAQLRGPVSDAAGSTSRLRDVFQRGGGVRLALVLHTRVLASAGGADGSATDWGALSLDVPAPWRVLHSRSAARVLPRAGIATRFVLGALVPLRARAPDGGGARMALLGASLFLAVVADTGVVLSEIYLALADRRDAVALVLLLVLQPAAVVCAPAAGVHALFAPWGEGAARATRSFVLWNASSMLPLFALFVYALALSSGDGGGEALWLLLPPAGLLCKLVEAHLASTYLGAIEHDVDMP